MPIIFLKRTSTNTADFQRNPVIEKIVEQQVRTTGSIIELATPDRDVTFPFTKKIPFKFLGTSTIAPPYNLFIYSNKVFDFENDYKVLSTLISGTPLGKKYNFSFSANVSFPKDLYHLFLQS